MTCLSRPLFCQHFVRRGTLRTIQDASKIIQDAPKTDCAANGNISLACQVGNHVLTHPERHSPQSLATAEINWKKGEGERNGWGMMAPTNKTRSDPGFDMQRRSRFATLHWLRLCMARFQDAHRRAVTLRLLLESNPVYSISTISFF